MEQFTESPRSTFIAYFLVAILAFVAICAGASVTYLRFSLPKDDLSAQLSAVASLVQAVLAPAVSLAGSIVAIVIAAFGLSIVKREAAREDRKLAEDFVRTAVEPSLALAASLNHLYASFITLWGAFRDLEDLTVSEEARATNSPGLIRAYRELAQKTAEMAKALEDVTVSPRSMALLVASEDRRNLQIYSTLRALNSARAGLGLPARIAEISGVLKKKSEQMLLIVPTVGLNEAKLVTQQLIQASGAANIMVDQGLIESDLADKNFARLGALIWVRVDDDGEHIENLGLAILMQICDWLPTSTDIRDFSMRYVRIDTNSADWKITESYAPDTLVEPHLIEFFRRNSRNAGVLRIRIGDGGR